MILIGQAISKDLAIARIHDTKRYTDCANDGILV